MTNQTSVTTDQGVGVLDPARVAAVELAVRLLRVSGTLVAPGRSPDTGQVLQLADWLLAPAGPDAWYRHSVTLNDVAYKIAVALGRADPGDPVTADPVELVEALIRAHADADLACEQIIAERDQYHQVADHLAYAIAPQQVIGEHSSANDPWANALQIASERAERASAQAPA